MKDFCFRKELKIQLVAAIIAVVVFIITSVLLGGCLNYLKASCRISKVEKAAKYNSYYTENGWFNGWNEELTQKYNEAVAAKEELIKSSQMAQWCSTSAQTLVGHVIRDIAIMVFIIAWLGAVALILYIAFIDVQYYKKHHRV